MTRVDLLLLWLIVLPLLVGCSEKIDTHEEFVEVAWNHERRGDLPDAITAYRRALELNPQAATTWYDLGVALANNDQPEDAVAAYSQAIELDPSLGRAFNNRAAISARLNQLERAVQDWDQALALDPLDFIALRNRGLASQELGDPEKAESDFSESLRVNGRTADTWLFRGNLYLTQDRWQDALRDLDQAQQLDDTNPVTWLSQATAFKALGQPDDAERALERARELGASPEQLAEIDSPASVVTFDIRESAVAFVCQWLEGRQQQVKPAAFPWDLQASAADASQNIVVRVLVSSDDSQSHVDFTQEEIDHIRQEGNPPTTLVILRLRESVGSDRDAQPFELVRAIEDWSPDTTQMVPSAWSLPVSATANPGPAPGSSAGE